MPKQITYPAAIIAARGKPIALIDGTQPTLVYGFASIMRLEDDFGSLGDALKNLGENMQLGAIVKIMCAGLLHEGHPTAGPLSEVDNLAPLLDTLAIGAYSEAIGEAFSASFPNAKTDDEADPTPGADRSPGPSGTTSQPSPSDAPMISSGV